MPRQFKLVGGGACPEQYDVFHGGVSVGYLRLRHGHFRAECNNNIVYTANTRGDGSFHDDQDRQRHLTLACLAIDLFLDSEVGISGELPYVIVEAP